MHITVCTHLHTERYIKEEKKKRGEETADASWGEGIKKLKNEPERDERIFSHNSRGHAMV